MLPSFKNFELDVTQIDKGGLGKMGLLQHIETLIRSECVRWVNCSLPSVALGHFLHGVIVENKMADSSMPHGSCRPTLQSATDSLLSAVLEDFERLLIKENSIAPGGSSIPDR
ncbi:hypothetical protein [Crateriforma conspicua]|uniref:hypothetical protein n=1 Tax=Crateriforma TaxID=2714592 RepID=UPI001E43FD17|nr:hypothetical protein [Crateriforma conspicua]